MDLREFLQDNERMKVKEYMRRLGAKEFADRLAAARERDAQEFIGKALADVAGQSEDKALRILSVMAADKLAEVGYKEFAVLFREKLKC